MYNKLTVLHQGKRHSGIGHLFVQRSSNVHRHIPMFVLFQGITRQGVAICRDQSRLDIIGGLNKVYCSLVVSRTHFMGGCSANVYLQDIQDISSVAIITLFLHVWCISSSFPPPLTRYILFH